MYPINFIAFLLVCLNFAFVFSVTIVQRAELAKRPNETSTIDTNLGSIIGYKKVVLNKTINVFYGVPYALPPINELRFKRTKLIKTFSTQPLEALTFKPHCMQAKSKKYNENDRFEEDCLYINMWTPNLDEFKKDNYCTKKFDTIAYLYGGVSSIYQMSPLLDAKNNSHLSYSGDLFPALHDVIFVTINYRQGLFSSLYVEHQFQGNLALFDQSLALQWIKQNIESFCGNGEITLAGNSLGGMATGLHVISKYSKNLVKNAIIQSGAPLFQDMIPVTANEAAMNSFVAIRKLGCLDISKKNVFENIKLLDNDVKSEYFDFKSKIGALKEQYFFTELDKSFKRLEAKMKERKINSKSEKFVDKMLIKLVKYLSKYAIDSECLKNLPADQIVNLDGSHNQVNWQITYDFDFIDTESYLDYQLFNKLNFNPKLNLLIGGVADEQCSVGVLLNGQYYTDQYNPPQISKKDAQKLIENFYTLIIDKPKIASLMALYYTDESKWDLSKGYYESFVNVGSDYQFDCPAHFYASYGSRTANTVQAYRITQMPSKHFGSNIYDLDYAWAGPCHADELNFIFGLPFRVQEQFTDLDRDFSQTLIRLWAAFAKNGKMPRLPSNGDKWPVSNKQNGFKISYVEINSKYIREREFEFEERCDKFWKPLLPFYKRCYIVKSLIDKNGLKNPRSYQR